MAFHEAFILLVLLTSWLPEANLDDPANSYDMIEMFAGVGVVSRTFRRSGLRSVAIDLAYDESLKKPGAMDLTTPSGLVLPSEFNHMICSTLASLEMILSYWVLFCGTTF